MLSVNAQAQCWGRGIWMVLKALSNGFDGLILVGLLFPTSMGTGCHGRFDLNSTSHSSVIDFRGRP